jgi:hypothetical protein
MKHSTFFKKARSLMKKLPQFRQLQRQKLALEKRLAAGKISERMATDLKRLVGLRVKRLLNRQMYKLLCEGQ